MVAPPMAMPFAPANRASDDQIGINVASLTLGERSAQSAFDLGFSKERVFTIVNGKPEWNIVSLAPSP